MTILLQGQLINGACSDCILEKWLENLHKKARRRPSESRLIKAHAVTCIGKAFNTVNQARPTFLSGTQHAMAGWKLIRKAGLRRFVWMPIIINLLVFAGLGWLLIDQFSQWLESLSWINRFQDWWIIGAFTSFLRWIAIIFVFAIFSFIFSLVANLLAAPFNGLLAEKVEAYLTGHKSQDTPTVTALLISIPGTFISEGRKLLYLGIWVVPLLLLHAIPVVNFIAPFLLFIFGMWMYSIEYMDYPLGNNGHRFASVRALMRENRSAALGFGLPIAVQTAIPLLNIFIMPVAVAGATSFYVRYLSNKDLNS